MTRESCADRIHQTGFQVRPIQPVHLLNPGRRRHVDLSEGLADHIDACKAGVDRYQRNLLDAGKIDYLDDCERVRTRLDTLASRVRGAVRGYSGAFDFVRVDEDLLDQVYDLDVTLVDEAEWLLKAVDEVLVPEKEPAAAIAEFLQRVEQLHRQFDRRTELLQGLGPGK